MSNTYNTRNDAQGTPAEPLDPSDFDYDSFAEHEAICTRRCREFWASDSGVLVHRRFRVPEVYSYGCRDMQQSLAWQLGALAQSVHYKGDVPNFLEPHVMVDSLQVEPGLESTFPSPSFPATLTPWQPSGADSLGGDVVGGQP